MKFRSIQITLLLMFFTAGAAIAGTNDQFRIDSEKVGVRFDNDGKNFIMNFNDDSLQNMHSVIDISRTVDLEYKTRVMRYFGGLLVNKTFPFKKIIVLTKEGSYEMPFNRENISKIVNMMCNIPLATHSGGDASTSDMPN